MPSAPPRRPYIRARAIAGITLLVLVSLFSTVKLTKPADQFVYKFTGITEIVPDDVTFDETRFSKLRPLLPRHGTVGYVTDGSLQDLAVNEKYLTVQYALAPIIVEKGSRRALVVGNIMQPTIDLARFLREQHVTLLKDFGNGVLLLHGTDQ